MVKTLRGLGIVIIVMAVILGIVSGYAYAPEPLRSYEDKEFLWSIAIMWWAGGIVSSILIFAFAHLLDYIEDMSRRLYEIENTTRKIHLEVKEP
ncbi:hypothetical protein [Paenibacillus lautus]|uniref:hypothetical protein n=1 Tax=Paenibacillus lautus TaxID=1401 RepID=UPI003D9A3FE9